MEDQHRFILHHRVMEKQTDDQVTVAMVKETKERFADLQACSFDKGFHSPANQQELQAHLKLVALPRKGKLSQPAQAVESAQNFVKARAQHSAVESAINALEVHGLDRCPDHGIGGFERCVALAVVARNIHRIGAILREQENGGPSARAGTQIVTCRTNWRHSRPSLFPWSDSGSQRRRSPECYGI